MIARRVPDDWAVIQATSGSTADPKCVALSHRQVLSNLEQIRTKLTITPADTMVSWLPMYHDMGLFSSFLQPLYNVCTSVILSTRQFLRSPATWLHAISEYRGTISTAPNFAFRHAVERIRGADMEGLDLSSWRRAVCGAEPLDPEVLDAFARRFSPYGFPPFALSPAYGLAEASVCVTIHDTGPVRSETLSVSALSGGMARPPAAHEPSTVLCDCGTAVAETELRIVDVGDHLVGDGEVGRILVRSPSVMCGYIRSDGSHEQTRADGWLDTGDLGYLRNGHLFVTGRVKDLIIIRGENYCPVAFEGAAAEVPFVPRDRVVAVQHDGVAPPPLFIICERPRIPNGSDEDLSEQIARHVAVRTGIRPDHVVMVARNTVERTTSGKLRRRATLERVLTGKQGRSGGS